MNQNPIGVFDSGLGGLTLVKQLRRLMPGESIVYFGDTGRVPYGSRGRDIIVAYAKQDIAFLLTKNVKTIVAACGTVSSTMPPEETACLPVDYTGIVDAVAATAVQTTKTGRVGILGTEATIASGSHQAALRALSPGIQSVANACPLFVPLVENGHYSKEDPLVNLVAAEYLAPIKAAGVDTVILGCTHYPLLAEALQQQLGPDVTLVDYATETALRLQRRLAQQGLLSGQTTGGTVEYYVSDDPARFDQLARIFLGGYAGGPVRHINIEEYQLPAFNCPAPADSQRN